MRAVLAMILGLALAAPLQAEAVFRETPVQFIAALGLPYETHGTNAQLWGLWQQDPGPRGVGLKLFPALLAAGHAPAGWRFDPADWWMEEHGRVMEPPQFALAPGQYVVTGGREVTTVLTIGAPDADGVQSWQLAEGNLGDVTHLGCRSARYTPQAAGACSPAQAHDADFPLSPGATMPAVGDCSRRDYQVLFVVGLAAAG